MTRVVHIVVLNGSVPGLFGSWLEQRAARNCCHVVQLGWEGSILEGVQGVLFCMLLSLTGWLLLVHKTHRVTMFNTIVKDRSFILSPSFALFLLYNGLSCGLAFSRCDRRPMRTHCM